MNDRQPEVSAELDRVLARFRQENERLRSSLGLDERAAVGPATGRSLADEFSAVVASKLR